MKYLLSHDFLKIIKNHSFYSKVNPGANNIIQRSEQSSVTIPYERSFRRIGSQYQPTNAEEREEFQFCGCGWPQHMILPKGTVSGTLFDIFVMISDYNQDHVEQVSERYSFQSIYSVR